MKNYNAEFYFQKPVIIINPFISLSAETITTPSHTLDVQFFPEGGNLIAGLKSKVGFKANDLSGNGINVEGMIINQFNDTVTTFKSLKFGIGQFPFTPKLADQYRALIRDHLGKIQSFNLPAIRPKGFTIQVTDSLDNQLHVNVKTNNMDSTPGVYLFIHARNVISHAIFHRLENGAASILIDKQNLAEGTSHITIFDLMMNPVCERLYFKRPKSILTIDVKTNQPHYEKRSLVHIDLTSTFQGLKSRSNLSVSVFKVDSLPSFSGNIKDFFWLTSDLKGNIENPEYYFSSDSEVKQATDNLMLTHGWRRFQWSDVLADRKKGISFIPERSGHIIHGNVLKNDGSPASWIKTYLSSSGKIIRLYPSLSNEEGKVKFEMQDFFGLAKIIVQTNFRKDSLYTIKIKPPFSNQFSDQVIPPFSLSHNLRTQLVNRSVAMQVQDIYFSNDHSKIKPISIDSSAFYGKASETYLLDDYTRFPVMEEVMREYVPGVFVRKRKDGFHFMLLNDIEKNAFNESPLILLDGVPIFDEDEIMNFSPVQVKKLEVVTKRWFLGELNFDGIVSYTTYNGDLGSFQLNPKCVVLDYEGLQLQREFYSPKYETKNAQESRLPDQRHLLYWNPDVVTDTSGRTELKFYTSDISGDYSIVVEGMANNGATGNSVSTFTVRGLNN
jgi:hypothetical protein